jgi:AcrR family transcriptional regulator
VKGSLYHYFDSKEQIYERLVQNVIGTLDVQEELSMDIPADVRMLHILRARLAQTTSHPIEVGLISRQLVRMEDAIGEWARKVRRENFSALRELIVQGQRDGCFRAGDPDILAATLMGLLTQVCDWYRPDGRVNRDSLIDEMSEFMLGGLRDRRGGAKGR